jgi:hypothetical protein
MTWKFALTLLLISASAGAQNKENKDWLKGHSKFKSFKCQLTETQMNDQLRDFAGLYVNQIGISLRARGSEYDAINMEWDPSKNGLFPKDVQTFDAYALQKVSVVIQRFNFQIQTSVIFGDDPAPTVMEGLWFPLTIKDTGADKICKLQRIAFREDQRKFIPQVNLVIGSPPTVVAAGLVEVMDVIGAPAVPNPLPQEPKPAPVAPAPQSESPKPAQPDANRTKSDSDEQTQSKRKKAKNSDDGSASERRRERRREARERRREERRERREERRKKRERRHRSYNTEQPQTQEAPAANQCAGDISPWKSMYCNVTGQKQ